MSSTISVLFRLKLRLIYNQLINWNSAGKVFSGFIGVILMILGVSSVSIELFDMLKQMPGTELIMDWLVAAILTYTIFLIFTGDLITGHTLNSGQMSQDFSFLCSLPISATSLIAVKLFERFITDYLGALILLSGFIGVVCREGLNPQGIIMSLMLYTQISLAVGLGINLVLIMLQRFFRAATINNFFSVLGYFSAFLTFVPYLIVSSYPADSIKWIYENLDFLNATFFRFALPAKWLGICFIKASFCNEFFLFTLFWIAAMIIGCFLFYLAVQSNWLHYSHSAGRVRSNEKSRLFSGWLQKELILVTRDFNLAINAILMPLSIIVLEIYFLRSILNFSSLNSLLNIISGAVIYFCMFGPVNAIGSEGKAITILETIPMQPSEILRRKYFFWLMVAEMIFIPATITAAYLLNHNHSAIITAAATSAIFTAACVWVAISISAIFAVYDSKMLQQRSTLAGKLAGLAIMLLASPVKGFSINELKIVIIFICIGLLLDMKARICMFHRLDLQSQNSTTNARINFLLLIFITAGIEAGITSFFSAVAPGTDTGYWSTAIAMTIAAPASVFIYLSSVRNLDNSENASGMNKQSSDFKDNLRSLFQLIVIAGISTLVIKSYPEQAALFKAELNHILNSISTLIQAIGLNDLININLSENLCRMIIALIPCIFVSFTTLMIVRLTGSSEKSFRAFPCRIIALAAPALNVPKALVPIALITGLAAVLPGCMMNKSFQTVTITSIITAAIMTWGLFF